MAVSAKRRTRPRPPAPSRSKPWWQRPRVVLLGGLIVAFGVFALVLYDSAYYPEGEVWVTQDDAYISYRYARHALEGAGLVFNSGERVEGYTNFLWVLWLIVAGGLGFEFDLAAKVLGVMSALGMILFAAFLGRGAWSQFRPRDSHWGGVLGALLVAANGSLAYWAMSGLETTWFGMCVAASSERVSAVEYGLSLFSNVSSVWDLARNTRSAEGTSSRKKKGGKRHQVRRLLTANR